MVPSTPQKDGVERVVEASWRDLCAVSARRSAGPGASVLTAVFPSLDFRVSICL